jgi:heterodisulfide reductase subunit A
VTKKPRFVDPEKCIACGLCAEKCPAKTQDEFQEGLARRKAIYLPYPQAVPLKYVIDEERCIYFKKGKCKACEKYCPTGAILLGEQERQLSLNVGAVILSGGMQTFDPKGLDTYQYSEFDNVVTSLEFERILSAGGPTGGHVERISDHQPAKRIAWLQCVGSRDINRCDNGYCSSVCCMYAIKEAAMAMEHVGPDCQPAIFFMDMRTTGKEFERYYNKAEEDGIRFVRTRVHSIIEKDSSGTLSLSYADESGNLRTEDFDLVVLSVGMEPSGSAVLTARQLGLDLDHYNFVASSNFAPVSTSRPGVYVAGVLQECKDIPQSVMEASAAACNAGMDLARARGELVQEKIFPEEIPVDRQEPRIGVFVCNCGTNIGGIVDVPSVAEFARSLPGVAYVEENQFTCAQDTQEKMIETIREQSLNRVVVAACTPRTHEPLFQETIRDAGLNKYLFEMANIRNQCSWVHSKEPEQATAKSKDLVRMAVARANLIRPLEEPRISVNNRALIIGGGLAGMTSALSVAEQGFEAVLVEQADQLGGTARQLRQTWQGEDIRAGLKELQDAVTAHPKIEVHTNARASDARGFVGNFETVISENGRETEIKHGAVIVAVGAREHTPTEYLYGEHDRVLTHLDFDTAQTAGDSRVTEASSAVFIQCVGSREPERPYCSKVCCTHAIKSALALKEQKPDMNVYVLNRDIRTYGHREDLYKKARQKGVTFIRFDLENKPRVQAQGQGLEVSVHDPILDRDLVIAADLLVLAAAIVPGDNEALAQMYKLSTNEDAFFMEAHPKLRPVEFATAGIFVAGLAHYPKPVEESIAQAKAAAAKAAVVLSRQELTVEGVVSRVDEFLCRGCGECVQACPFAAIELVDRAGGTQVAEVKSALCKGCGACAVACPTGAADIFHYEDDKIMAMVESALD